MKQCILDCSALSSYKGPGILTFLSVSTSVYPRKTLGKQKVKTRFFKSTQLDVYTTRLLAYIRAEVYTSPLGLRCMRMRSRIAAIAESIARICTNAHAHVHKWVWATGFLNMYIFGLETARAERKMSADQRIIMYANPRIFRETTPLDSTPAAAIPQEDKYHRIVLEVSMLEVETALTNRPGIEFAECNTLQQLLGGGSAVSHVFRAVNLLTNIKECFHTPTTRMKEPQFHVLTIQSVTREGYGKLQFLNLHSDHTTPTIISYIILLSLLPCNVQRRVPGGLAGHSHWWKVVRPFPPLVLRY